MSETITITRRSIVGFGYTSAAENDERGNLQVCKTVAPDHTGTIAKVQKAIESDRTLRSFQSGTYYSTAWFVKIGKTYRRIITDSDHLNYELSKLSEKSENMFGEMKYMADAITVEVE